MKKSGNVLVGGWVDLDEAGAGVAINYRDQGSIRLRDHAHPPDNTWGPYTGTFAMTPGQFAGVLNPNNPAKYIQLKFDFSSMDKTATPKLKSFKLYYNCLNVPG